MNTKSIIYSYALFLLTFLFCLSIKTNAQLQANFTIDKPGGCSPLSVQFTNTTTGTSATTTYQWTFGNGNSSALTNPGATYYDEKTYTVSLTAKEGVTTSTKTLQLTVYKKPTVDFSVSPGKGCVPLPVNFTSNATPGDGTISKYFWDFGDGATEQGSSQSASHIYAFPQKPPISLTVTNSYGCYTNLTKSNLVEAVKGVTAAFTASSLSLCKPGDEVNFTSVSTGSGTLTYSWDFGDGKTSTEQSPKHVFASKGTFTVKLVVKSSDGCSATATSVIINVANFVADFDVPALICQGQTAYFTNKSTAGFDKLEWWIDNAYYSSYSYATLPFASNDPGEHTIKLTATYGLCDVSVTKKFQVNPVPQSHGFVASLQGACGVPVTINFKDTTSGAVKWNWQLGYYGGSSFASTQAASHTFTSGAYDWVYLTVTNKEGCSNSTSQYVYYDKPNVNILVKSTTGTGTYQANCTGIKVVFMASPDTLVKDYKWNFGDGTTSTDKEPVHIFNKAGTFIITLDYTTVNGCKGNATYNNITVVDKPKFDFSVAGSTTICGNTPTTLTATPAAGGWNYYWYFNGQSNWNYGYSTITRQFDYDTTYTVQMISYNGFCRDTITKADYLKVLPPFPKISGVTNTCENTRGMVRFTESSYKALQWSWDFGDASPKNSYSSFQDTIRHTYTKTGSYKVVLSTTNGTCTVKDSINAYVLLKQKPVLSSTKSDICGSDVLQFKLAGMELNPYPNNYSYYSDFYVSRSEYSDLSNTNLYINVSTSYWRQEVTGNINNLQTGKNDLRMITTSVYFNCQDTSNFIPLKVHGPTAGFLILAHNGCFKNPVFFKDTSHTFSSVAIVKWQWTFGDGAAQTNTTGGTVSHTYKAPGYYSVTLTVTDADGCTSATNYGQYVRLDGPKADFSASAYTVAPNTIVYFYNNSQAYDYYTSQLKWIFPDGSESSDAYPSFLFQGEGKYSVMLVTRSSVTGCPDTAIKTITVKKVNSVFAYSLSYIGNNSCPPVMARFTSISTNYVRLAWDFGDGGTGGDQQIVSHTYNAAGIYRVVHYSYDANDAVDSTEDFIEVKGPYALIKADTLYACNALQVKLSADVRNAQDFTWDFGDGTLTAGTDTFATHNYIDPGIYRPAVILKDQGGCTATSSLPDKIVVDSLSAVFTPVPATACNTTSVQFTPQVYSLAQEQLQTVLQYRWIITENSKVDSFYTEVTSNLFTQTGQHNIVLQVTSPYGCLVTTTGKVDVKQGVKAFIQAPLQICKNETATFKGTSLPSTGTLTWAWNFGNNQASNLQSPPPQKFTTAGQQPISLVVSNGNCNHTALFILPVQEIPQATFTLSKPVLCLRDSMTITAGGGATYQWITTSFIQNTNQPTATVWPANNAFYAVKVTNSFGCSSQDSVEVKLVKPFQLTVQTPLFACAGNSVQLNASGADKYQWTPAASLSNLNIPNPVSSTTVSVSYSVVGYGNYNCFTDTKKVDITIGKLPSINAGPDIQVIGGSEVKLVTSSSSDVATWTWQPADFLSCANCASPLSRPNKPMVYVVTASTAEGCSAKDTVRIELICKSDLVYIPTGFTPNGDNLNERFVIHGSGIKSIVHFVVFDRWGKTVFERKNGALSDRDSSWDGNANGQPAPSGAYVYLVKLECDGGEIFTYQGTVTLIR